MKQVQFKGPVAAGLARLRTSERSEGEQSGLRAPQLKFFSDIVKRFESVHKNIF